MPAIWLFLISTVSSAIITTDDPFGDLVISTTYSPICNTFDEAHYCKMVTVDVNLNMVAISHKCQCPDAYRCPKQIDDTNLSIRCIYEETRQWNRCYLPCTPNDL